MKTLNFNSKQAQNFIAAYKTSDDFYLSDVYKSFSSAKYIAYTTCLSICDKEGGWKFRIISHNSNFFTVAWMTKYGLRIETAQNSYFVELPF